MDEEERSVRDSPTILNDPQLRDYLTGILCKTVGFDRCNTARIYIVKDKSFNASMAPNGFMRIHTGLLARVFSESELSAVLAHEFAHFELRHSLGKFRNIRRSTDVLAWVSLAGAVTNTNTSALQNSIVLQIFSYSRENERDADLLAAAYIRSSPYPMHFAQIWSRMSEEDNANREERKQRKISRFAPGPTDSHPTNAQRFVYLAKLEAEEGAQEGDDGASEYRAQTSRILPELYSALVMGNEFSGADYVIRGRGDRLGWDSLLLTTRGDLYRQRGNPRDLVTAQAFFQKATQDEAAPPEAWRGLGLTSLRIGETAVGKTALQQYLTRQPNAKDAASIKMLLED